MSKQEQLNRIENLLNRLDAAVVSRDPGNARSAEQFEGLRKQIGLAAKNHRVHVAHLLSLSDSIQRGATLELVKDRVNDFLNELGVRRLLEVNYEELFEIVEVIESDVNGYEVLEPAVIEELEGGNINPLRLGKAKKFVAPQPVSTVEPLHEHPKEDSPEKQEIDSPIVGTTTRVAPIIVAIALLLAGVLFGRFVLGESDSPTSPVDTTSLVGTSEPSTTEAKSTATSTSTSLLPATTGTSQNTDTTGG
jgi:hypothetical protein